MSQALLMVDDEWLVQTAAQEVLEGGGFTVIAAFNGADAIAILEERHRELAGLITDVRLGPGPDGWAVAHHARELNPAICVVYATGDGADKWAANGVPKSGVLQKPYADAQLLTAISNLLNEAGTNILPDGG